MIQARGERREEKRGLTLESEENKESKLILLLLRVIDLTKETEVIIALHRVVILTHNIGKSVRNIPTPNDRPRFPRFPRQEKEGEDDAAGEDPFSNREGDVERGGSLSCFGLEDGIGPSVRGEEGDGGIDVGDVDGDGFGGQDPEPGVSKKKRNEPRQSVIRFDSSNFVNRCFMTR